MDITMLSEYTVPVIVAVCLGVGYIVKKWINDVDNKFIPTIVTIVGVAVNIWLNKEISVQTVLGGMASGLASTGVFELVRNIRNTSNNSTKSDE